MSGDAASGAAGRRSGWRKWALLLIGGLVVALLALQLRSGAALPEGAAAPEFSLPRADPAGGALALADLRGRVAVLDFWSISCPPCIAEMRELEALRRRYAARGVEVIGIYAGGEPLGEVASWVRERRLPYPVVMDAEGAAAAAYGVRSLPTLYVVGRDGRIVAGHVGYWPGDELEAAVVEALGAEAADR